MKSFKQLSTFILALTSLTLLTACGGLGGGAGLGTGDTGSDTDNDITTTDGATQAQLTDLENALLAFINEERVANGLPELVRDDGLDAIMRWYGTDMLRDHHIGHVDANGRRSEERVRYYSGRNDVRCSEITAWWSNGTASDHYNAYKASPGHHSAYMEEGIFNLGPTTHVGVAAYAGTGPEGSQYEGISGTYSGLVFCDNAVTVAIDPFKGIAVGSNAASTVISADNGGSLQSVDDQLTLDVPAMALTQDTEISVTPIDVEGDTAYEFLPNGLVFDEPATTTLTLDLDDLDIIDEDGNAVDPETVVPGVILFLVSADGTLEVLDNVNVSVDPENGTAEVTAPIPHFTSLISSVGNSYYVYMTSLGTHYEGTSFKADVDIRYLGFEGGTSYQNMSITYKVRSMTVNKISFEVSGAVVIATPNELSRSDFLNQRGQTASTRPRFICNDVGDGTVKVTVDVTATVEVTFQPENRTHVFTVQQSESTTRKAKCIAPYIGQNDYYNDGNEGEEVAVGGSVEEEDPYAVCYGDYYEECVEEMEDSL